MRSAQTIRPRVHFLPQYETETQVEVTLNEQRQVTEGFPRSTQNCCRKAILAEDEKARANKISIGSRNTKGEGTIHEPLHTQMLERKA